jgi:hypothetical protein
MVLNTMLQQIRNEILHADLPSPTAYEKLEKLDVQYLEYLISKHCITIDDILTVLQEENIDK